METKVPYKIPELDKCKKYIKEAEKIDDMPDDEVDVITLNFDEVTLNGIKTIAELWGVSTERVLQTLLIALVRENEE